MPKKTEYRYIKIESPRIVKKCYKEGELYVGESIRTAEIFNKNKKDQIKKIESSTRLLNSIIRKLNKLDVLLHEKSI